MNDTTNGTHRIGSVFRVLLLAGTAALPASAMAQHFSTPGIAGTYVISSHGSFSSAPPPFTGDPLDFEAAQVGLLTFDGSGNVYGEHTLTFHHPAVPFAVRSRFAVEATYAIAPDGHLVIEAEEYRLNEAGVHGATPDNTVTYECYFVRFQLAECLLYALTTYQQGPEPKVLPLTMSGSLQRQQ